MSHSISCSAHPNGLLPTSVKISRWEGITCSFRTSTIRGSNNSFGNIAKAVARPRPGVLWQKSWLVWENGSLKTTFPTEYHPLHGSCAGGQSVVRPHQFLGKMT